MLERSRSFELFTAMLGYTFIAKADLHAKEEEMRQKKLEVVEEFLQLQS